MSEDETLNTQIIDLPLKMLRLLPEGRNARFMRHEQFQRLVGNIKRDGTLTSVPLVRVDDDGGYTVLSGNHRIQAAVEALGEDTIVHVMVATPKQAGEMLTKQRALALQLSHNAIAGEDDPALLRQLYDELDDVDWREYSGLDDEGLELLTDVKLDSLSEANLDFQSLTITFLPGDRDRLERVIGEALSFGGGADIQWVARYEEHSRLLDDMLLVSGARDARNVAVQLAVILDVFEAHATDLTADIVAMADSAPKNWVPLGAIFGTDRVPAGVAAVLVQALQQLVDAAEIPSDQRWRGLEYIVAEFMAGYQPQS